MANVASGNDIKAVSGGKGRRLALIMLALLAIALFLAAAPLFIVFAVGMVPTVVGFICDRDREKYTAIAIGAGNLSGVVPFLVTMAMKGPTLALAGKTVTDIFSIALMYGGAAAGWLIVAILPSVVAVYMNVTTEARIQRERKQQEKLVEDWGAEVAAADPPAPGKPSLVKSGQAR